MAALDHDTEWGLVGEDADWRARAATFAAQRVAPVARTLDREGRFAPELIRELGASGLLAAGLPGDVGGGGASTLAQCAIAEEIGAVDGSLRGFLAVQGGLVLSVLLKYASDAQRESWLAPLMQGKAIGAYCLTEAEAGSDVGAMQTIARDDGDGVVLDGEKVWITNGGVADVLLVFASRDRTQKTKALECFLVMSDAEGLTRDDMPGQELGHRASNHARLRFEGVRVPKSNRVGPELGGFKVAMSGLDAGRLNVAAGAVGAHRACLDACVHFARNRRQFGTRIGDFQQVGATLAEMDVSLRASRLLVHHAARLGDQGLDARAAISAAKLRATEAALTAAQQAIQMHGSRGYTDELPLGRHWRDLIALTIYEGTSNIQRVILARHLLGRDEGAEG